MVTFYFVKSLSEDKVETEERCVFRKITQMFTVISSLLPLTSAGGINRSIFNI